MIAYIFGFKPLQNINMNLNSEIKNVLITDVVYLSHCMYKLLLTDPDQKKKRDRALWQTDPCVIDLTLAISLLFAVYDRM